MFAHTRERFARETRARSRMCTRANHGRGAAATVCAGWECWRWYGGGSVGALAACSLSVSFLSGLSLSLSLSLSVLPCSVLSCSFVAVPLRKVPLLLPSLSLSPPPYSFLSPTHLICSLPGLPSICLSFSSHSPCPFETPAEILPLSPQGEKTPALSPSLYLSLSLSLSLILFVPAPLLAVPPDLATIVFLISED
jgi:hypothetical protein